MKMIRIVLPEVQLPGDTAATTLRFGKYQEQARTRKINFISSYFAKVMQR